MGLVLLYVALALSSKLPFYVHQQLPSPFIDTVAKPHLTYIKQNVGVPTFAINMWGNFS